MVEEERRKERVKHTSVEREKGTEREREREREGGGRGGVKWWG